MGNPTRAEVAKARRYAQPVLRLDGRAMSPEAAALVSHCLECIVLPSLPPQQRRPSSVPQIRQALGGMLAGLIAAAGRDHGAGWLRRPLSNGSFTGEPVGRAQFRKALDAMHRAGLLDLTAGFLDRTAGPHGRGADTRIRLSEAGRKLAADYGVTLGSKGLHFAAQDVE